MSTALFPTWIDGRLCAPGEAFVSTDDAGFQLGLAVFETVHWHHGTPHFLDEHLARMRDGMAALSIELAPERAPERALAGYLPALRRALDERGLDEAALRLVATRGVPGEGASLICAAREVVRPPAEGVVVALELRAKLTGDELEQVKSSGRVRNVLAREAARRRGAWDALLCNEADEVCEATIANVFARIDGTVVTPAVERGCLAGVMRGKLLEVLAEGGHAVSVDRLPIAALARADEVFLSNSTGRVVPVRAVLDVAPALPGPDGPLVRELAAGIRELEERHRNRSGRRG